MTNPNPFTIPEPGKYISLLADHPGYVRFAHPFLGRHYKAWLRASESTKDSKDVDFVEKSAMFNDWRAAYAILEEWKIDGVVWGDVDERGENVPLEVIEWVRRASINYLAGILNLKNLQEPSETT